MRLFKLYKKDFYSKLKVETNFNTFNPINKTKTFQLSSENKKKNIPKNFPSKKVTEINLSFDNSIIEGGNNFSLMSIISDISLGDQETMTSEKSTNTKMVKIVFNEGKNKKPVEKF
jgi:hypothetical protein